MRRFELGRIIQTRGVYDRIDSDPLFMLFVICCLKRYEDCDWGEICDDDKAQSDLAVKDGGLRIFASYKDKYRKDWNIWIITEADRSHTTVLFPDEY
jgi:hypothetical protein